IAKDDGRPRVRGVPEHLPRIVGARAHKPLCARHPAIAQNRAIPVVERQIEILDDGAPEALQVIHGPLPQGLVVGKAQAFFTFQPLLETGHLGTRDAIRAGGPQDVGGRWAHGFPPAVLAMAVSCRRTTPSRTSWAISGAP